MTDREKQIEEAAKKLSNWREEYQAEFIAGAQWADENPAEYRLVIYVQRELDELSLKHNSLLKERYKTEQMLTIAVEALETVKDNGAKASDEKWNVINETLAKIENMKKGMK